MGSVNDISKLPPEFSRAERFDGIFFLDLPGPAEREAIWKMYVAKFGLDANQARPVDTDWTGAEIRSCCRLTALLDVSLAEAAQNVVPVAKTACEAVERLRGWGGAWRLIGRGSIGAARRWPANPGGRSRSTRWAARGSCSASLACDTRRGGRPRCSS